MTEQYWVLVQTDEEAYGEVWTTVHRSLEGAKAWALKIAQEHEEAPPDGIEWTDAHQGIRGDGPITGAHADLRDGQIDLRIERVEVQD